MELNIIKTNEDYQLALNWVEDELNLKIAPNSPEGQKLKIILLIIKDYEEQNYPIPLHIQ